MTGDEMQRAIEFLLKTQANFETHFEETNRQWQTRFELQTEETNRQIAHTNQVIAHTNQVVAHTNQVVAHTNQVVEALAETQTEFTQTVLGFITSQDAMNESCRKELDELEQAILDLTRTVDNFINFSSGNGNSPRE